MFHNLAYSDPDGKYWLAQRGLNESFASVQDTGVADRDEGHGALMLLIYRWSVSSNLLEAQFNGLSGNRRVVNRGMKVNKPA